MEIEIADPIIGIVLFALGIFLTISGIGLIVVLLSERNWWEATLTGMLSMELPDFGLGGMQPLIQEVVRGIVNRILALIKLAILGGGLVIIVIGIGIALVGLGIWL